MKKQQNDALPLMLTRKEFAAITGFSERFIDRKIQAGEIKVKYFGSRIRIPQSSLEAFVKA